MGYPPESYQLISRSNLNAVLETVYLKKIRGHYKMWPKTNEAIMNKINNKITKVQTSNHHTMPGYQYLELVIFKDRYPVLVEFTSSTGDKIMAVHFATKLDNNLTDAILWKIYRAIDLMELMVNPKSKKSEKKFRAIHEK